jgi:hypothetical protein
MTKGTLIGAYRIDAQIGAGVVVAQHWDQELNARLPK